MTPLLLVGLAHAHPSVVPHAHGTDTTSLWIVAAWMIAASAWAAFALRRQRASLAR